MMRASSCSLPAQVAVHDADCTVQRVVRLAKRSRHNFTVLTLQRSSALIVRNEAHGEIKDDSRPPTVFTAGAAALGYFHKFPPFRWTNHKRSCHAFQDTLTVSALKDSLH